MTTRPVHIAHLLQTGAGGGYVHAAELAEDARAHGARVTLAAPAGTAPPGADVREFPAGGVARTRALGRIARGADLIHVHGPRVATWGLPVLPLVPSVVTYHGLHPLRRPAGALYRQAGRALIGASAAAADLVICVSQGEVDDLAKLRPAPRNVRLVRNGIAPEPAVTDAERAQARAALELDDAAFAVLLLGRLTEAKDVPTALRVADALAAEGAVLLVAGDGELADEAAALAGPSVRLLGARPDVRRLLAACDVLLSTSLWEGMPLALLEAMMAGRPVVASDVPGNAEAVGPHGLLAPVGDVAAFADALRALRGDPARRAALASAARERMLRDFSLEAQLRGTADVYSELLGRPVW